ncbi:MAG: XRE family transcriptional regulator [Sphingobium sp.]
MSVDDQAGLRIRELRIAQGMTLVELGETAGLPVSTLSKLENNKMSLSYDKLVKIAVGLDVEVGQLLSGASTARAAAPSLGRRCLTPRDEGPRIETADYIYRYLANDLLNKRMTPMIMDIKSADTGQIEMSRHPGEEFIMVTEGRVRVVTELYAPMILGAGDTMYFDAGMGHAYLKEGEEPARLLSISSASAEELAAVRAPALPSLNGGEQG